ncbi:DNA replication/repair protein RecF [Saccharibacter floricola]|uniref:DNA replication/repair protein RecF n=1 Tax=Saccharibacter floricola TaxID=231053 RepID=UPI00037A0E8A|nr:DNA replication/repair protein RecF [Saccharibacter floricola]
MKLLRLALTDFRNYQRAVWEPHSLVNVLYGLNGSGKTNLLEALSLLSPGRGLHGTASHRLSRNGTRQWGVASLLQSHDQQFRLATGCQSTGNSRRLFLLDDEPVKTQSDITELCACVWLTPKMDRLFSEGASQRRRFFDRLVAALMPDHAKQLVAHDRSVASRNRILATQADQSVWLDSIEASISRHAVAITAARLATLEQLHDSSLSVAGFPKVTLNLRCSLAEQLCSSPALHVEDWLRDSLKKRRETDRTKGLTSVGAHRADLTVRDSATHQDASFLSSGQQKIMLLSLILSHGRCVQKNWGEAPLVLLDEPFVHLDEKHRAALMEAVKTLQTTVVLTGTDAQLFLPMKGWADFIRVEEGNLYPERECCSGFEGEINV